MADVGKLEFERDSLTMAIKTNTQAFEYNEEEWHGRIRFTVLDIIRYGGVHKIRLQKFWILDVDETDFCRGEDSQGRVHHD